MKMDKEQYESAKAYFVSADVSANDAGGQSATDNDSVQGARNTRSSTGKPPISVYSVIKNAVLPKC
jgi:hypothetical protein